MNFAIDSLFAVGRIVSTRLSDGVKNILANIEGDGDETEADEVIEDQPMFGHAGVLFRPADPTDESCELIYARRNNEFIPIATRDVRWQVDLEAGEVVVRSMSDSQALVRVRPDGKIILDGEVELGAGATEAAVLGTALKGWLDSLISHIDSHIHPSAAGPTGAPPVSTPALPTILSSRHTID